MRLVGVLAITVLSSCLFPNIGGLEGDASTSDGAGDASADGSTSKYRDAVLADSPVAYWRLGDSTPVVAKDELGAHSGTVVGANVTVVSGALAGEPDTAFHFGS